MPTDVSRFRDGENQRSDQSSPRRDASPKSGRVHDFATHQYQIFEQQRRDTEQRGNGKGPASAELRIGRAIAENGDYVPRTVNLARESIPEKPRLLGGTPEDAKAYIDGLPDDKLAQFHKFCNRRKQLNNYGDKNPTVQAKEECPEGYELYMEYARIYAKKCNSEKGASRPTIAQKKYRGEASRPTTGQLGLKQKQEEESTYSD